MPRSGRFGPDPGPGGVSGGFPVPSADPASEQPTSPSGSIPPR